MSTTTFCLRMNIAMWYCGGVERVTAGSMNSDVPLGRSAINSVDPLVTSGQVTGYVVQGGVIMKSNFVISVNGVKREIEASSDTPLLLVLRNELQLSGPRFGCGLEQCGSCLVLRGSEPVYSCRLAMGDVGNADITTVEGLGTVDSPHPVQQAFFEEQAAQCGYCSSGMLIAAAALIWRHPHPTDEQIQEALDGNLCRCGSHTRIVRAVHRAADLMWGDTQ